VCQIFSRHLQESTQRMMSVVGMFQGRRAVVADEGEAAAAGQRQENQLLRPLTKFPSTFVLDCEVVAVDSTTGALLSMQSMGARGTRLCVFAFDLLVCNGEALVGLSLRERRERLRREFGVELGRFQLVESTDILATSGAAIDLEEAAGGADELLTVKMALGAAGEAHAGTSKTEQQQRSGSRQPEEDGTRQPEEDGTDNLVPGTAAAGRICALVRGLCADAVAAGCEGLMAKSLDGPTSLYAPALRSETSWIKLKRDYLRQEGMGDTLDVVPIAAWRGSGRKAVSRTVAPLD
jgi:DNA ligase-1